jgi:hypothetical protein
VSTVRYDSRIVARAREHAEAEWGVTEIQRLIEREFGRKPTWPTVAGWIDEEFAARRRRTIRRTNRAYVARKHGPRPHVRKVSAEWKLDRMRELHEHGLSFEAIGKVAAVWWGESLSGEQVARRLRRLPAKRKYERRKGDLSGV